MTARRLTTDRLDLITATAQHLLVAQQDMAKLARLLGAEVGPGWPPPGFDDAATQRTLGQLHRGPDQIGWWTRYVVLRRGADDRPVIIGAVAFAGAAVDGRLTASVAIVGAYRNRGFATEATRALVDWGFDDPATTEVLARPRPEHGAAIRVLERLGFEHRGDGDDDTLVYAKSRDAWLAEGPASRRAPKLVPAPEDVPVAGIPPVARDVFDRFLAEPLLHHDELREEMRAHLDHIQAAAADNPYVDEVLARDIVRVCEGLLDAVVDGTPEWTRRQIQAAARYFSTEEDGDGDLTIGGLDEDAAVANAVAMHLGRGDLVSEMM